MKYTNDKTKTGSIRLDKKLITLLFFIPILLMGQESNRKIQPDKIYHTSAGALITEACYIPYYTNNWDFGTSTRASFAVFSTLSMGKEMADAYGGGYFSFEDIGYGAIGWGFTVVINYGIHRIRMKNYKKKQINKKNLVEF